MTNWYTTLKLAMPLPQATNSPNPQQGGPVAAIDQGLTQPQADQINKDHPNMHFLGRGQAGLAYGYNDPNKVVKLTRDGLEAERAKVLVGQPATCHVQVYDVQEAGQGVWKLVIEKVRPLTPDEIEAFDLIHLANYDGRKIKQQDFAHLDFSPVQIKNFISQYQGLCKCLRAAGVSDEDAQGDNLGRRNGQLVLLDVG